MIKNVSYIIKYKISIYVFLLTISHKYRVNNNEKNIKYGINKYGIYK